MPAEVSAALGRGIASACEGRGSAVLVKGPAGSGKSDALAVARQLCTSRGMRVLGATGRREESGFGLGVALQLFEHRLDELGRGQLSRGIAGEVGPSFEVIHAIYRLCAELTQEQPLALVVDDADLADVASLRSLLYLAERLEAHPALLVLACGTVPESNAPDPLRELGRVAATATARLRPLTVEEVGACLREAGVPGPDEHLAATVHRETGGNRLLTRRVAEAILASREPVDAAWLETLAPAGVADWALRHSDAAGHQGRAILSAVAILGPRCEVRHAAAMAGLEVPACAPAIDALAEMDLLEFEGRVSCRAPLVARSVERALGPAARASTHLRAAFVIGLDELAPERAARHLLVATPTGSARVAETLCAAASVALGRGAPGAAVNYLRRALEEPPPRRLRAHVVLELGRAEAIAGDPQGAIRLSDAVETAPDTVDRPGEALTAGGALSALGRPGAAVAIFDSALGGADGVDPETAGALAAARATAAWFEGFLHGAPIDAQLPAEIRTRGDRALAALHAFDRALRGSPRAEVIGLAQRALGRGSLLDDETSDGVAYYLATGALAIAEDLPTAELALTAAVQDAQQRGSVLGFATASHARAMAILMRGRLDEAASDARNALSAERDGWRIGFGGARAVLAEVCIETDDLVVAADHVSTAAELGDGDPFRIPLLLADGRIDLLGGDADTALDKFRKCGRRAERSGIRSPAAIPWRSWAARALAVTGDWDEARKLADEEIALAEACGVPGAIGRALRTRAAVSEPTAALEALAAAVEALESSQAALERARALVDYGAALRRSGRRGDGRGALTSGLELAERCGARVLAARARREANLAGARPRRTALSGRDALTQRERQTASLAAEGLTNREIAERLVVTVKTVEWHLKHAYRKLGVKSRAQLGSALGATSDGSD